MPDSSYLDWPFLEAGHRSLKAELDQWCAANSASLDAGVKDLDAACLDCSVSPPLRVREPEPPAAHMLWEYLVVLLQVLNDGLLLSA